MTDYAYLKTNARAGLCAEDSISIAYETQGACTLERRWRGKSGEIDLIFNQGGQHVFCEVKKSKSFDRAAAHLTPAQQRRIQSTALEYLAAKGLSLDTDMRFDAAFVDQTGQHMIIENALFA